MKIITISPDLAARYDSSDARIYDPALAEIRELAAAAILGGASSVEVCHPDGFVIHAS